MSPSHHDAWQAFAAAGWITFDLDPAYGGQGLPLLLAVATQELFDCGNPSFAMLPVPTQAATHLIGAYGDDAVRSTWLSRMISGEWTVSICVSEAEAGSDLRRMRTLAHKGEDGRWSVTGEKQWISFGDHDLSARIGHCLLARTATSKGLSLFLVPDHNDDGSRNAVFTRRIEEKMGLHQRRSVRSGSRMPAPYCFARRGSA